MAKQPAKLVVLAFEGADTATGLLKTFQELEETGHIKLKDAVAASRQGAGDLVFVGGTSSYMAGGTGGVGGTGGAVAPSTSIQGAPEATIKQTRDKRGRATVAAGGVGLIVGSLLGGPVGGLAVGALIGALRDRGIDNKFINNLSKRLKPNTSALFLLVESADADAVLKELKPFNATLIHTTLTPETEKALRKALKD
jgi:uncharacterized membrane protein